MTPFPLLRLPGVVLCEIFKSLSIGEKIKLSLCSKKISIQINSARLYSQKVILDMDMLNQIIRVHSEYDKDTFEIFIRFNYGICNNPSIEIEGRLVFVISYNKGIKTFWENDREGVLSVVRYLLKKFRCKFSISNDYNGDRYNKTIFELFDLQLEFKKLTIYLNGLKGQHLLWNQISPNLELVEDLVISTDFVPGFRPVFILWPQKISIWGSAWFTLVSLLTCTCSQITLGGSLLENEDLDEILRKWKAGGFPNLERMKIIGRNITNNRTTILGMNLLELRGKVIQTNDGSKKATINTDYGRIEMSVSPFE